MSTVLPALSPLGPRTAPRWSVVSGFPVVGSIASALLPPSMAGLTRCRREQGDGLGRPAVILQDVEVRLLLRDIEQVRSRPAEGDGQAAEQVVRAGRREGAGDVGAAAGGVEVDDGVIQRGRAAGPDVDAAAGAETADLVIRDGGVDGRRTCRAKGRRRRCRRSCCRPRCCWSGGASRCRGWRCRRPCPTPCRSRSCWW